MTEQKKLSRLRFSLRSLLILVLLIGSATTLWWHWEPWTLERILIGHEKEVWQADFSPDGKQLITLDFDKKAIVWNTDTGVLAEKKRGDNASIGCGVRHSIGIKDACDTEAGWTFQCSAFSEQISADGRLNAHTRNNDVQITDYETYKDITWLKGHTNSVMSAAFSPDSSKAITASRDGTARIWDARSGTLLVTLKVDGVEFSNATFSPDGAHAIAAGYDHKVRIWDARTGDVLAVLLGHSEPVAVARYSPDGNHIVTASWDKTVRMWRYRRPERWWGLAWLPEFWLTILLFGAGVWSYRRDRRTI